MKWCGARRTSVVAILLVSVWGTLAAAQVTRPLETSGTHAFKAVALAEETQLALTLPAGGKHSLTLGRLEKGFVWLYAGLSQEKPWGGSVRVRLAGCEPERDCVESCELTWPSGDPQMWSDCRLGVPRPIEAARIDVECAPSSPGTCLLSSPIVVPAARSDLPPVFVLLTDTVRADRLKTYNPKVKLGDEIARFAADAVVFDGVRAPSSWTRPAVATLFTGLSAHRHGVHGWFDRLPDDLQRLPTLLRARGYRTTAWSTNANVLPDFGFMPGFDRFVAISPLGLGNQRNKTHSAEVFRRFVEAEILQRDPSPAFHYIHLMDAHRPYAPTHARKRAILQDPLLMATLAEPTGHFRDQGRDMYAAYLGEIGDLDQRLGTFFRTLRQFDLYDRSLILMVSDHGEEFFDHGGTDHASTLYDELVRTAVILKLPGNRLRGQRVPVPIAYEDIMPTVLGVLGVPPPPGIDGRAVIDRAGRLSATAQSQLGVLRLPGIDLESITDGKFKLIHDRLKKTVRLYQLDSDPGERQDVSEKHPERRRELEKMLTQRIEQLRRGVPKTPTAGPPPTVNPAVKEQLRALGYDVDR